MLSFALLLAAVVAAAMMPGVRGAVRWLDPSLVSSDVPPDGGTRRDAPWGDAATAFGALLPGDTLRVLAGHYNSQLRVLASGNAENWITVEAETLGSVTFDVQASCCIFFAVAIGLKELETILRLGRSHCKLQGADHAVRIVNQQFVRLRGFRATGSRGHVYQVDQRFVSIFFFSFLR